MTTMMNEKTTTMTDDDDCHQKSRSSDKYACLVLWRQLVILTGCSVAFRRRPSKCSNSGYTVGSRQPLPSQSLPLRSLRFLGNCVAKQTLNKRIIYSTFTTATNKNFTPLRFRLTTVPGASFCTREYETNLDYQPASSKQGTNNTRFAELKCLQA